MSSSLVSVDCLSIFKISISIDPCSSWDLACERACSCIFTISVLNALSIAEILLSKDEILEAESEIEILEMASGSYDLEVLSIPTGELGFVERTSSSSSSGSSVRLMVCQNHLPFAWRACVPGENLVYGEKRQVLVPDEQLVGPPPAVWVH